MADNFWKVKKGLNLPNYATAGDLASIVNPQVGDVVMVGGVALYSYNGSAWVDTGSSGSVTTVQGMSGNVLLDSGDIPEDGNLYFTDARAKTAAVVDSSAGSQTDQAMSVSSAKSYTDGAVSAEASLRSAADATLQGNIDAEALARAAADTTLQNNITSEASTRAAADTTLQGNIDAEALARSGADTTLQNNINAEASARSLADTTLQGNIDAEQAARIAADSSEASTRAAADTTLQNNIDAEESARISADVTLQGNINSEASVRAAADTTLQNNITAEASTRAANDLTLQGNIDAEQAARIAADSTLQGNIDAEALARAAADTTLQGNIDAEAAARAAADALLIPLSQKAAAGGVATLDVSGKIPSSQLPPLAISSVTVVATIAERDALTPQEGDFCVVTSVNETFIYDGSAWIEIVETSGVVSVNGLSGVVSLSTSEISEGSNLYFTDTRAKSAAVLNSSTGSETDQAMSVSAAKSYIAASSPVLSVNGETGIVALDSGEIPEGSNLYFTDARAKSAAVIDSMAGSETDKAPSVSSAKGAIQFRPEYTRYVSKNGSDSTGNGSPLAPYYTIQAAMDSLPAPVPGSNVEDYAIYIYPGVYNETITWTRSNTHLIGLQAPRKSIQAVSIAGGIDFAIVNSEIGGIFQNISSVSNCLLSVRSDQTRNVLNFNGSEQVILQLLNSQVYQPNNGYSAISMNNTAASLSRLYLDNCVVQCIGATTGHAIDLVKGNLFSGFNCEIYRTVSTDASVRAIKLSNNSVVTSLSNAQVASSGDYAIEMAGTGNCTLALTLIQNTSANKSGVYIAAGTVFTSVNCTYAVPAGSGFAVTGAAGSVMAYAADVYTANATIGSSVIKSQLATDTTTSVISEGSNLYFTTARARTAAVVNSTSGNETDQAPSVSAMKAFIGAISTGVASVNGQTDIVQLESGDIPESSNLYFTDARAKSAAVINNTAGSETDQAASVSAMKNYVSSLVDTEAITRAAADVTLQSNIDAEALARAAADTTLQGNIDAEAAARAAADALLIPLTQKAAANGVATLDGSGKIPASQLPPVAITSVTVVATIAERDALTPQEGDFCIVTSVNETYVYNGSAWIELLETSGVVSVNGLTGSVSLSTTEIGEGSNLYFTDLRAKSAAVVNSSAGSQTDQAMSVSAAKAYTDSAVAAEASLRSAADTTLQTNIDNEVSARIAADALLIPLTQKGATNGVATLDGSGKVPVAQIPFDASPVTSVNGEVGAVILDSGDVAEGSNLYFTAGRAQTAAVVNSTAGNETTQAPSVSAVKSYVASSSPVLSVNGETGSVLLNTADVPENTNLYFTDARAKTAAVVNSSAGSQTDQAMSVSAAKAYTDSSVAAEASLRSAADTTLQGNIDSEASARAAADLVLQGNIDAEASARAAADALLIPLTQKAAANGVATLDSSGKIPSSQLPPLSITSVTVVATIAERDALTPQEGDFCVVTGVNETYIYDGSAWVEIIETSGVTSVNGQSGSVSLSTTEIGEGSNLYFTDARAKTAAVVNSSTGSETDQAMSVSAAKAYTNAAVNTEALARQSADALLIPLSQKGAINGVATLDASGYVPLAQINPAAVPVTSVNALTGDVVLSTTEIAEGTRQYFTTTRARTAAVLNSTAGNETTQAPSVLAMKNYVAASSPVLSVNDLTGAVVLTTAEISEDPLGTNLYFTDTRARTAAVVNSTVGNQTNQAASVSAMKAYIAANTISGVIRYGASPMANSASEFVVNFSDIGSTSYVVVITISNGVDLTVRHLSPTVTTKTSSSFTFVTAQTTDSANYVANYYIIKL